MWLASLCPVLPIGAGGLAGQDRCSRVGACAHRFSDATVGSALDCDLERREDARHGGRARPGLCRRCHPASVTAGTACLRKARRPDLAAVARPSGLPPERARHGRRPEVGQKPLPFPAHGLVVVPVSVTHSRSMTSRPLPATGPGPGARRAGGAPLKPFVEKVVTARRARRARRARQAYSVSCAEVMPDIGPCPGLASAMFSGAVA
jgi:hypothetical protein